MELIQPVLIGAPLAALVSALAMIAARMSRRARGLAGIAPWGGPLALGAGFLVGFAFVQGRPMFPPVQSFDGLFVLVVLATILGLFESVRPLPAWARWGVRMLATIALLGLILFPLILNRWSIAESAVRMAGFGIGILVYWASLDALAQRARGASLPLLLMIPAVGGVAALVLSASLVHGMLWGIVPAVLAGLALATVLDRDYSLARGGTTLLVAIFLGLGLDGYYYTEIPERSAQLLILSPAAAWLLAIGPVSRSRPRRLALAAFAFVAILIPVGWAIALALQASNAREQFDPYSSSEPGIRRDDVPVSVADTGKSVANHEGSRSMCELLALSFARPISANFSFLEFGARCEENPDGWGLGWYPDQSLAIIKEPVKWAMSPMARFLADYARPKARITIAHVRHKTTGGEVTHADTHPFSRESAGRDYCFAHNGTLQGPIWDLPFGRYRPLGRTDSERAFCHLLDEIALRPNILDDEAGWHWLHQKLSWLNEMGKFNCLLSDGRRLFVYHDIAGWKGLTFRKVRIEGGTVRQFEDQTVALALEGETSNEGIIVASKRLSGEGWHDFRLGELIVLEEGHLRYSSHRRRAEPVRTVA